MSERFKFDLEDGKKLLIGAGIAAAGAVITYVTEWVGITDFGVWTPTIVAGWSIAVNAIRKVLSSN